MFAATFRVFSSGVSAFVGALGNAGKAAMSFGNIFNNTMFRAVTASALLQKALGSLSSGFNNALQSAKQFSNISLRLGMKPSEIASISEYAKSAGISMMVLGRAMQQVERFGAGGNTVKKFKDIKTALGLSNEELLKLKGDGATGLATIAERLQTINDEGMQMKYLTDLFGNRGAMQMKGLLLETAPEDIAKGMKDFAMGDATIKSAKRMEDVSGKILKLFNVLGADIMAALEPLMGWVTIFGVNIALHMERVVNWIGIAYRKLTEGFAEFAAKFASSSVGRAILKYGGGYSDQAISNLISNGQNISHIAEANELTRARGEAETRARFAAAAANVLNMGQVMAFGGDPDKALEYKGYNNRDARFRYRPPVSITDDDVADQEEKAQISILKIQESRLTVAEKMKLVEREIAVLHKESAKELKKVHDAAKAAYEEKRKQAMEEIRQRNERIGDLTRIARLNQQRIDQAQPNAPLRPEDFKEGGGGFLSDVTGMDVGAMAGVGLFVAALASGVGTIPALVAAGVTGAAVGVGYDVTKEDADNEKFSAMTPAMRAEFAQLPEVQEARRGRVARATLARDIQLGIANYLSQHGQTQARDIFAADRDFKNPVNMTAEEYAKANPNNPEIKAITDKLRTELAKKGFSLDEYRRQRYVEDTYEKRELKYERYDMIRASERRKVEKKDGALGVADYDIKQQEIMFTRAADKLVDMQKQIALYRASGGTQGVFFSEKDIESQKTAGFKEAAKLEELLFARQDLLEGSFLGQGDSMQAIGGGGSIAAGSIDIFAEMRDIQKDQLEVLRAILHKDPVTGYHYGTVSAFTDAYHNQYTE